LRMAILLVGSVMFLTWSTVQQIIALWFNTVFVLKEKINKKYI
jgi:hypothetical protein